MNTPLHELPAKWREYEQSNPHPKQHKQYRYGYMNCLADCAAELESALDYSDLANRADDLHQIRELQARLTTATEALERITSGVLNKHAIEIAQKALAAIKGEI